MYVGYWPMTMPGLQSWATQMTSPRASDYITNLFCLCPTDSGNGEPKWDSCILTLLQVDEYLNLNRKKTKYRFSESFLWFFSLQSFPVILHLKETFNLVNFTICDCWIIRFLKILLALCHFNTFITLASFSYSIRNIVFPTHTRKMPEELRKLLNKWIN